MSGEKYWRIFAEEVPADLGIDLTEQQQDQLTHALVGAHENYGLATGDDVANANWRASENKRLIAQGEKRVLDFIKSRIFRLDSGPSFFTAMSHDQKLALHEIFDAERFLSKDIAP